MSTTTPVVSRTALQYYIDLLYPDAPDDGWLVVSWLAGPNDFRSRWFLIAETDAALNWLEQLAPWWNAYIGLGVRNPGCAPDEHVRGTSTDVIAIGGLWVELDHKGGIHSATNLPTPEELQTFLENLPFQCSLVIDSGGGVHAYLLFKELWLLTDDHEHEAAALLLRRFQRTIQMLASQHGWKVDSTADLARVLRPAGTLNHKGNSPKTVSILAENPIRYNPSDIADAPWLAIVEDTYAPPSPLTTFPPTSLDRITSQCAWLLHCRDDAATLSEPEWYAMLGILGRCEQGPDLVHEWSQPYPHYDAGETNRKLEQALKASGPRTCANIRYDLGGESLCRECSQWGKIKSPIVLGIEKAQLSVNGTHVGWNGQPTVQQRGRDPEEHTDWYKEQILPFTNKRSIVEANDTTICAFLQNHSYWQGKLWWDDMANKPMIEKEELTDYLITKIGAIFGRKHFLPIRTDRMLARCLAACCAEHKHDPLQAWLKSIPGWDGIHRLESWLEECAGVVSTAYNRFVSHILPVSMIARAFDPGCLYRNVIVFEGPEEYRKSSLVSALVPEKRWHLSLTSSFENKDVPMLIQGIWVAELTELDSLTRTEETRLKSFISETEDAYVPKWQLFRIAPKRRTIFVGTTNESNWLKSGTGNTRFLPVRIFHPMDVEYFINIREQLFAEAMLFYADHRADWWDMPSDAQLQAVIEREERRQASIYEPDLGPWLDTGRFQAAQLPGSTLNPIANETTWHEIATGFLRLDTPEKWKDIGLQKQVVQALKSLGWRQKIVKYHGKNTRVWRYEPPAPF